MLGQLEEPSEAVFVEDGAFVVLTDAQVLLDCLVNP